MARDFREPGHLPNLREGRQAAPPEELPRQRNGITPQMHGRYPDYNVLDEVDHWDDATIYPGMDPVVAAIDAVLVNARPHGGVV